MSVQTVIVENVPKLVARATAKDFGVVVTQAPIVVGGGFDAVAYVDNTKISVTAPSEGQAWSELKAAVQKEGGKGKVAIVRRKVVADYSDDWKEIKVAKKGDEAEGEAEPETPAETPAETKPAAAGGRRGG